MKNIIQQLKNKPILSTPGFKYLDYWQNKAYYQENFINTLSIQENRSSNEKLLDVTSLGIKSENYYFKFKTKLESLDSNLNIENKIFLRSSVANSLAKIDQVLSQFDLCLFLMSGYRSLRLQQTIMDFVSKKENGQDLQNMLASPNYHLPHATGAAFDLEIIDLKTKKIIPTKTDLGYERYILEKKKILTSAEKEVRDNRRLIHHLLTSDKILDQAEVFIAHPFEYWHYSRFEKLAAFFSGQENYPIIYPHVKES